MSNVIPFQKKFFDLTAVDEPSDYEYDLQLLLLDFWAEYYEELKKGGFDASLKVLLSYSDRIMDIQEK